MTYQELGVFGMYVCMYVCLYVYVCMYVCEGKLRKMYHCGPVSMFEKLKHLWRNTLSLTVIANKVKKVCYGMVWYGMVWYGM